MSGTVLRPAGHRWYPRVKACIERASAVGLLVAVSPLILLAALLIKLTSSGPAFYTQVRLGKSGRPFRIYKLRTMIHKCESLTGARWCIPGDPRITPVGLVLRFTHLDELPQLLNVINGDMSLIGPRPERPEFLPELEAELPGYRQRLQVPPGVTGLAQVQLPADTDVGSVRAKLAYDLYYIRHLGPWTDLRLLICTLLYTFGSSYRTVRRLCRLPESEVIEREMGPFINASSTSPGSSKRAA